MNKTGSLESQLMDAFKEKEEKETATTAADAQKLADKEIATQTAKVQRRWGSKFDSKWHQNRKKKRRTAKASRKANR